MSSILLLYMSFFSCVHAPSQPDSQSQLQLSKLSVLLEQLQQQEASYLNILLTIMVTTTHSPYPLPFWSCISFLLSLLAVCLPLFVLFLFTVITDVSVNYHGNTTNPITALWLKYLLLYSSHTSYHNIGYLDFKQKVLTSSD